MPEADTGFSIAYGHAVNLRVGCSSLDRGAKNLASNFLWQHVNGFHRAIAPIGARLRVRPVSAERAEGLNFRDRGESGRSGP